jgi:hypothetical protein
MLWLSFISIAACPAHDAFWLPSLQTQNNQSRRLPFQPELSILCCNGILGAIPRNPREVKEVRYHQNSPFALLSNRASKCPTEGLAGLPHAAIVQVIDTDTILESPRTANLTGYVVELDSRCVLRTNKTKGTPLQCAHVCNRTSGCAAFTVEPPFCYFSPRCTMLDAMRGAVVYRSAFTTAKSQKKNHVHIHMHHTTALFVFLAVCAFGLIATAASRITTQIKVV